MIWLLGIAVALGITTALFVLLCYLEKDDERFSAYCARVDAELDRLEQQTAHHAKPVSATILQFKRRS